MTPSEKKLEKLKKLLEIANEDFVKPEEVIEISKTILAQLANTKAEIEQKITKSTSTLNEADKRIVDVLSSIESKLKSSIETIRKENGKNISDITEQIYKEVKKVEKKIPNRIDLSSIENDIVKLREQLNTFPTELTLNNEAVRDGLELLDGDNRLDKSAIRGLDEVLTSIAESAKERETNFGFVIRDVLAGTGVTIDKSDPNRPIVNATGSGGGHTIEDEGTPLTQRDVLNFVGDGVTVTDDTGKTVVTIPGGGGGAVDSVNGETGVVVLDADDIDDTSTTNKFATTAQLTKVDNISITQAVDLDALETASHPPVTVTDSTEINFTLTGQDITASIVSGSIDESKLDASTNASLDLADSASQPGHTHTSANVTDFSTAADARISAASGVSIASLSGGKIPTSQLPAIALTDVFSVASEVAQLALTAEEGDVAIRTDQNKSYIHNGGIAGTMADWSELLTPTDTVLSINGETGAVTLTTDDISDAAQTNKWATSAEKTKLGYITVTQAVDLDQIESDTTANNAKVTNATHTGDVTGSTSLTLDKTAITNKTTVTVDGADYVLISDTSDTGNLKKVLASDLTGGGGISEELAIAYAVSL